MHAVPRRLTLFVSCWVVSGCTSLLGIDADYVTGPLGGETGDASHDAGVEADARGGSGSGGAQPVEASSPWCTPGSYRGSVTGSSTVLGFIDGRVDGDVSFDLTKQDATHLRLAHGSFIGKVLELGQIDAVPTGTVDCGTGRFDVTLATAHVTLLKVGPLAPPPVSVEGTMAGTFDPDTGAIAAGKWEHHFPAGSMLSGSGSGEFQVTFTPSP